MCTASIGQPGGCQLTSGLPQYAECCHVQHQCHRPLSRVGAETQLSGSASVQYQCSSGGIPSSPRCTHQPGPECSIPPPAAAWHLLGCLQVGSGTPTPWVGTPHAVVWAVWDVCLILLPTSILLSKNANEALSLCSLSLQCKCCVFPLYLPLPRLRGWRRRREVGWLNCTLIGLLPRQPAL